jgi:hypothetical protein
VGANMSRCVGVAAMLPESDRKDPAIRALARSATISDLSARHGVSRKFVYQQARKAGATLDDVFLSGMPENDVVSIGALPISKPWSRKSPDGSTAETTTTSKPIGSSPPPPPA